MFGSKVKATPSTRAGGTRFRVRQDRVGKTGKVTLRHESRLLHIAIGRAHAGRRVVLLVADVDVRVLADDGRLIRRVTIDPSRNCQPLGTT